MFMSTNKDIEVSLFPLFLVNLPMNLYTESAPPPPPPPAPSQSNVIVLRNMVTVEDLDEQLEEEVTSECSKYGTVVKVSYCNTVKLL